MAAQGHNIAVFKSEKDGFTYIVEPGGAAPERLHHADRCTTLQDMPQSEECVVLPVSAEAIHIWKEAVDTQDSCGSWGVQRVYDIRKLAEVCEFLQDDSMLSKAVDSLASLLQEDLKTRVFPPSLRTLPGNVRVDPVELQQAASADKNSSSSAILHVIDSMHCTLQAGVICKMLTHEQLTLRDLFPHVKTSLHPAMLLSRVADGSLDLTGQLNTAFNFGERTTPADRYRALSYYIGQLPNLKHVGLSNNGIGDEGAASVANSLQPHVSNLSSLSIGNNGNLLDNSNSPLWSTVRSCTALISLDVSKNWLSLDSLPLLVDAVAHMSGLRSLNIGFVSLLDGLMHALNPPHGLRHLTYLNISNVTRDFTTASAAVSKLVSLEMLDASDNRPTWFGAVSFLRAVRQMPKLRKLALDNWRMKRPRGRHHESLEVRSLERFVDILELPVHPQAPTATDILDRHRSRAFHGTQTLQDRGDTNHGQWGTADRDPASSYGQLRELSLRRFCDKLSCLSVRQRPWSPLMLQGLEVVDFTGVDLQSDRRSHRAQVGTVDAICGLARMKELHVPFCGLSAPTLTLMCGRLAAAHATGLYPGLQALNWSGNEVSVNALEALCTMTTLQGVALRSCRTSVNHLHNDQDTLLQSYRSLGQQVSQLQALEYLSVGDANDRLEDVLPLISQGCRKLPNLRELEVGRQSVTISAASGGQ